VAGRQASLALVLQQSEIKRRDAGWFLAESERRRAPRDCCTKLGPVCATPRAYSLQGLSLKTSGGSFNSRLVSDVDVWQAAERALKQPTPAPPYYRRGPLSL
jgi:hypothetical protein